MIEDIEYARVNDISLLLDLYPARSAHGPQPAVIWIHGGGWNAGDKRPCLPESLTHHGYAVACINYRLRDQAPFPAQLHDCKAAVRFLRAHAQQYGLDAERIGAAGHSAGGHLAALLGTTADMSELDGDVGRLSASARVQAVCTMAGPSDLIRMALAKGPSSAKSADSATAKLVGGPVLDKKDKARYASPTTYVSSQAAPFLIIHGDRDQLVPCEQAQVLHDALVAAGVKSILHRVAGGDHVGWEYDDEIHALMRRFFDEHLV
jgi:acetyl esterase/lipase